MSDELRQVVVVYDVMWDRLEAWAKSQGWALVQMPTTWQDEGEPPTFTFSPSAELMRPAGEIS